MTTCYALDLKDDPALIATYDAWHTRVWPEVLEHLRAQGITHCSIHRAGNRLFMIVESTNGAGDRWRWRSLTAARSGMGSAHDRLPATAALREGR